MRDDSSNDSGDTGQEKKGSALRMRAILGGAALGVLAAFAAGIWFAYVNADDARFQSPPLIKAPQEPVKVRPENPGGLQVPDRDKLVLKSIEGKEEPKVEKLLPPPERPMETSKPATTAEDKAANEGDAIADKIAELEQQTAAEPVAAPANKAEPAAPPARKAATQTATQAGAEAVKQAETMKQAETAAAGEPPVKAPEPAMPEPAMPAPPKAKQNEKAQGENAAPAKTAEAGARKKAGTVAAAAEDKTAEQPAEKVQKKAQKPVLPKKFRVQLGAFKTADITEEGWRRLSKKFPAILGKQPHYVIAVTLGSRGVFHRLQFGAFDTRAQAKSACARLKAKKQDCLVIAP